METGTRIVHVEKDYVVLFKCSGLDTVPLKKEREKPSLLSFVGELYPECLDVGGANYWEGGILHRLDRPTSGLVLAARSQSFYDKMIAEQEAGRFIKHYMARTEKSAILEGFPHFPFTLKDGEDISSKFRKYGKGGKSVRPIDPSSYLYDKTERIYTTHIDRIDGSVFYLTLSRGFRHQIRAHLAWAGCPISGDTQYGGRASDDFGLEAVSISYIEPCSGRKLTITS